MPPPKKNTFTTGCDSFAGHCGKLPQTSQLNMRCREEEEQEALSQTSLPILRGEREKETGEAVSKMKRIGIHPLPVRSPPTFQSWLCLCTKPLSSRTRRMLRHRGNKHVSSRRLKQPQCKYWPAGRSSKRPSGQLQLRQPDGRKP